jgi:hypothetical protein
MSTPLSATVYPPLRDDQVEQLRREVRRARNQPGQEPDTSVTIGVSGGPPSQRYVFMVRLDGGGTGEYRFEDDLGGREPEKKTFDVPAEEAARIFGLLDPLVEPGRKQLYDPDSLVGFVTVRAGKLESKTIFSVWEPGEDRSGRGTLELPAAGGPLLVDPRETPDGLTALFDVMSSLAMRSE